MGIEIVEYEHRQAYIAEALPFLAEAEAENSLMLGISSTLDRYPEAHLFRAEESSRTLAVALMTPPFKLVVSWQNTPGALEQLAAHLRRRSITPPGVLGPREPATGFATLWTDDQGRERTMEQRVYRLTEVDPPPPAPGGVRLAAAGDADLVSDWCHAFAVEAGLDSTPSKGREAATYYIRTMGMYLWEDEGRVVSMAGAYGPTPNGIRVGMVYTPPDLRRRGYASSCVASVSQKQLDGGRTFCFLHTDLANPTSNAIYQRIGYQPVCDFCEYRFI